MWHPQSILRRSGRRHMPGICRYPAKGTGQAVKQGGTADKRTIFVQYSSLTEHHLLSGRFLFYRLLRQKEDPRRTGSVAGKGQRISLERRQHMTSMKPTKRWRSHGHRPERLSARP